MKIKHLKMKASVILTLFCALQMVALNSSAQEFNINLEGVKIALVLEQVKKQSDYRFFYREDLLQDDWKVSVQTTNAAIEDVLKQLFADLPIDYIIKKKQIILKSKSIGHSNVQPLDNNAFFDQNEIYGNVSDSKGYPLMGVTVWRKGSRSGTVTNDDGNYRIEAGQGDTLVFNFLGFKQQEKLVGDEKMINVMMQEDVNSLDAVNIVSTGYQKINRERATGSFSTIDGEELQKVPVNNVMHQLEGRVPGLQVDILESDNTFVYDNLNRATEGNTSYNFRIRGQSTYNSNQSPLIVIDGAPTELDIKNINSNDVEKITFLKDAASASIYGARAANGVIVIDTKKGVKGKARINFSTNYTFSTKPSLSSLPLMNSSEVLDLEQELVTKGLISDPATAGNLFFSTPVSMGVETYLEYDRGNISAAERDERLNTLRGRNNYDQITKYLMQPSSAKNYNLSINGGNGDYNYFTSASYSKEETQTKGNDGERLTLTVNQNFKLFDFVDVSTSLKGSFFDFNQNGLGLQPLSGSLYTYLPYDSIVDDEGNPVRFSRAFYKNDIATFEDAGYLPWEYSYLEELRNSDQSTKEQNYSANLQISIPLVSGLNASGTYYIERSNKNGDRLYNEDSYYTRNIINEATSINPNTNVLTRGIPLGSIYQRNSNTRTSQTTRAQLNYNKVYGANGIDAIAGIEFRETRDEVAGGTVYGYNEKTQTSVDILSLNYTSVFGYNSTLRYGNTNTDQRRRFLSYYGNAAYNYKSKYVLTGSIRLDDYNNFGVDKKYRRTPLWSTGIKWNAHKEAFLNDVGFINNLAFRATYGYNGNISLTTFPFTRISIADVDFNLSQLPYAFVSAAANPALRWEKTGVLNFGIDFGLFENRLSGSIEYYRKNSEDLIQDFPVSDFYGLPNSTLTRNTSTLKGNGLDLNLSGVWLKTDKFTFDSSLIVSYNQNEVTDSRYDNYSTYLNGSGSTPPIEGYPLNSLFAFRSAGLDENGSVLVYDRNGETVNAFTQLTEIEDMKYVGTRTPQYYGSFNTTFRYDKISLFVLATYKFDYKMFKPTFGSYVTRFNTFSGYSLNSDIADRWQESGDENTTNVPGVSGLGGFSYSRYRYSDHNVISGDHIRLREIALNYDLSSVLVGTFIHRASLSLSARNLGMLWRANNAGIDPDFLPFTEGNQIRIPPTAMYTIGLNINF